MSIGAASLAMLVCSGVFAGTSTSGEISPRIVNGLTTEERPSTGALLKTYGDAYGGVCSGVMIGCETFLTAAHCVCRNLRFCSPDPSEYSVYLQHAGIFDVSDVDVEPNFFFGVTGDVAVLTLSSPVSGIPPTPINYEGTPALGMPGTIVGFGNSSGARDDYGLKREGRVTTDSCSGLLPVPQHLCWSFTEPVGKPGKDSNTCYGDSGGPLLMDFGGGDVVAGVTSGGFSSNCLAEDLSFDANVYEYRSFIDSVGGADLSNSSCGGISQVGESETTVITSGRPGLMDRQARACRAEIGKQISKYVNAKSAAMQSCFNSVNDGKLDGACPDAKAALKIEKAEARLESGGLAKRCTDPVIATAGLGGECSGVKDLQGLLACIKPMADTAVSEMLEVEYADDAPAGPIPGASEKKCQKGIAKAGRSYTFGRLKALRQCQKSQEKGTGGTCSDNAAQNKRARLAAKLERELVQACGNPQVAALDASAAFGASCEGVSTVNNLVACQRSEHDSVVAAFPGLLQPFHARKDVEFDVPDDTAVLRITLNALDPVEGFLKNDLDIFLRRGGKPTPTVFDYSSENGGVYEAIEVIAPDAGTWHLLVSNTQGKMIPYQVTVTQFQSK